MKKLVMKHVNITNTDINFQKRQFVKCICLNDTINWQVMVKAWIDILKLL